jgi:Domain of unknown function (DUF1906)
MTIKGVDTTDRTLTGAILKANGYTFVCRYYQYGGTNPGKQLTAAEAREKTAAGIRIVANYETDGNPANTIATGERHARNFLAQHRQRARAGPCRCVWCVGAGAALGCRRAGGHVAGHNVDFDTALAADYGGWLRGEAHPNMALTQADANLVVATLVKDPNFQALIWRVAAEVDKRCHGRFRSHQG